MNPVWFDVASFQTDVQRSSVVIIVEGQGTTDAYTQGSSSICISPAELL